MTKRLIAIYMTEGQAKTLTQALGSIKVIDLADEPKAIVDFHHALFRRNDSRLDDTSVEVDEDTVVRTLDMREP